MINDGKWGSEKSDWACSEIIIINKRISIDEIECIENYLSDKYGLQPNTNPGNCLNNPLSLAGWYDGDSIDLDNLQWKDKSGYGFNNNGIITGSGFDEIVERDPLNELYLNDQKILIEAQIHKLYLIQHYNL